MSLIIVMSLFNGDTHLKIKEIAYSTNPRELMTPEQMEDYYSRNQKEIDEYE